mmetsp:Transcript_10755/g.26315  ORF Transcript_10755/g.26315 Transcript_10755/m.26315 type:complete len:455 (-) Transcript_10755:29-1393(-)
MIRIRVTSCLLVSLFLSSIAQVRTLHTPVGSGLRSMPYCITSRSTRTPNEKRSSMRICWPACRRISSLPHRRRQTQHHRRCSRDSPDSSREREGRFTEEPLPEGWYRYQDSHSGDYYYHSPALNLTTWHRPRQKRERGDFDSVKGILENAGKELGKVDPKEAVKALNSAAGAIEDLKVPKILSPVTDGVALGLDLTSGILEKGVDAGTQIFRQLSEESHELRSRRRQSDLRFERDGLEDSLSTERNKLVSEPRMLPVSGPQYLSNRTRIASHRTSFHSDSGHSKVGEEPTTVVQVKGDSFNNEANSASLALIEVAGGMKSAVSGLFAKQSKRKSNRIRQWLGEGLNEHANKNGAPLATKGVIDAEGNYSFSREGWDLVVYKLHKIGQIPWVRKITGDSNIRVFIGVLFVLCFSAMVKSITSVLPQAIIVTVVILAYRFLGSTNRNGNNRDLLGA